MRPLQRQHSECDTRLLTSGQRPDHLQTASVINTSLNCRICDTLTQSCH